MPGAGVTARGVLAGYRHNPARTARRSRDPSADRISDYRLRPERHNVPNGTLWLFRSDRPGRFWDARSGSDAHPIGARRAVGLSDSRLDPIPPNGPAWFRPIFPLWQGQSETRYGAVPVTPGTGVLEARAQPRLGCRRVRLAAVRGVGLLEVQFRAWLMLLALMTALPGPLLLFITLLDTTSA